MLDGGAIRSLNAWCGRRDLSWSAADPDGDCPVMLLQPRYAVRPWQRMMLILDPAELRLQTELGEMLASASDLPALLDALDGGVAEPARPPVSRLGRPVPAASVIL